MPAVAGETARCLNINPGEEGYELDPPGIWPLACLSWADMSGLRWHWLLLIKALLFRFANGWLCRARGFSFLVHGNNLSGNLVNSDDVSFLGLAPVGFFHALLFRLAVGDLTKALALSDPLGGKGCWQGGGF